MAELEMPKPEEIEEQKQNRFTRRVALAVACYAVALAVSSLGGGNAAKEMLLNQQQASDQWAYYQAKAIREHQYRIQGELLDLQLAERGTSMPPPVRQKAEELRAQFAREENRYG